MGLLCRIFQLNTIKLQLRNPKLLVILLGGIFFAILGIIVFRNQLSTFFAGSAGADPVAYWKFDEGTGSTLYDTVGSNDGSLGSGNSAPSWVSGDQCVSGKCLRFDGTDDYVEIPSNTTIGNLTSSLTVSGWIRLNSLSGTQRIFGSYRGASHDGFAFGTSGTNLIFTTYSVKDYISSDTTLTANRWYYIAAVLDSSYDVTFYVDGKQIETVTHNAASNTNTDDIFLIGTDGTEYLKGYIDELKVFNYIRSADQIKADYASRATTQGVSTQFGDNDLSRKLTDGLVGYWKFDEGTGTTIIDLSGNNKTGSLGAGNSAPSWSSGKYGSAVLFDGTNDYVGYSSYAPVTGGSPRTISAWVYSTANNGAILSWGNYSTGQAFELNVNGNGDIGFGIYNAQIPDDDGTSITNQWVHVAVTCSGNTLSTCILWKNGQVAETSTNTTTINTSSLTSLKFGLPIQGTSSILKGYLDEVRIYNRALDPSEVKALYNFAPGPVGYWKMDDGSGSSTVDSSGNSNNGSLGTGNSAPTWTTGKFGKALRFDGTNDYISIPHNSVFNASNFTISFWLNSNEPDDGYLFYKGNENVTNISYRAYIRSPDVVTGDSWTPSRIYSEASIAQNNWYYITFIYDGSSQKIYRNGILIDSDAQSGSINTNTNNVMIGARLISSSISEYYKGIIDEVKFYNYARTASQIIEDMNAGHPAIGTPVGSSVLHLKMDEGYGATANDSSPQNNDGTLATGSSAPTWTTDGRFGKALNFDGSGDFINVGNSASINSLDPMTVSLWVNPSSYSHQAISYPIAKFGTWAFGVNGNNTTCNDVDGRIFVFDGSSLVCSTSIIPINSWSYISFTRSGSIINLYINGINAGTGTLSIGSDSSASLQIGRRSDGNWPFKGSIDEVKIYPFALTADQVKIDYNQGEQIVLGSNSTGVGGTSPSNSASRVNCIPGDSSTCNAPVGEWNFEEGVGGTANDTSGNANIGALANGPKWTAGKIGKALKFDGSNDTFTAQDSTSLRLTSTGTVSVWVKPTAYPAAGTNWKVIFNKGSWGAGTNMYGAYYSGDTNLCFNVEDASSGDTFCVANTFTALNQWSNITLMWDGSNMHSYINGIRRGGHSQSGNPDTSSYVFEIGHNGGSYIFSGFIDQVRIYNYARTPAQIAWEYNKGAPVAWYKMDECSGTVIKDWAPNSNGGFNGSTGTLTVGATGTQTSAGSCSSGISTQAWNNGTTGKLDASLSFDGSDDYITSTIGAGITLATPSIMAWIYIDASTGNWQVPVTLGTTNTLNIACEISDNQKCGCDLYNAVTNPIDIGYDTWTHIACVKDGTNMRQYINGKLTATEASATIPSNQVSIGKGRGAEYYTKGQIDDVKIFNYALTPAQIKLEMNGGAVRFE